MERVAFDALFERIIEASEGPQSGDIESDSTSVQREAAEIDELRRLCSEAREAGGQSGAGTLPGDGHAKTPDRSHSRL